MTKERKAAIKQWESIKEHLTKTGEFNKLLDSRYAWRCDCWFCQYVRDNSAPFPDNGCIKCPLLKWSKVNSAHIDDDDCGCFTMFEDSLYQKVRDENIRLEVRVKACDLIIAALKGEHIWED